MKKYIVAILMLSGCAPLGAFTLSDIRNQVVDQTKLTITKSGGPAAFYDAVNGDDPSLKEGVVDHVLTNRYITLDLAWFSSDNKNGLFIAGPGIVVNDLISTLSPSISEKIKGFVPQLFEPLNVGLGLGWDTDRGAPHYGAVISYNFGK